VTPEEKVARTRVRYEASINGFVVQQQPLETPPPPADEPEGGESPEASEGVEEEGEQVELEPISLRQDVLVDVVIRHESAEKLDGITVDITMADGEREIETWRVWFDTSKIEKGPGSQFSHTLEDVDYQPGYGFGAEIRFPIPAEERSQYREFADAGS
jgi:hypothetical protein